MQKTPVMAVAGIAAVTLISSAAFADGQIIEIPIIDVASWDGEGSANNVVIDIPFAPGTVINGIGWDLFLTTEGASWASEATISLADNGDPPDLFLTPAAGVNEPSQPDQEFFSDADGDGIFNPDADIFKLGDLGIPDIVLDSGTLHLEFFETFDDVADSIDAVWKFGSIYIQVSPTPGALALMGIAGLAGFRRRRRA